MSTGGGCFVRGSEAAAATEERRRARLLPSLYDERLRPHLTPVILESSQDAVVTELTDTDGESDDILESTRNNAVIELPDTDSDGGWDDHYMEEEEEEQVVEMSRFEMYFDGFVPLVPRIVTVTADELRAEKLRKTVAREAAIEKALTEVRIDQGRERESWECCVCLEEICVTGGEAREEEEVRPKWTTCGHIFHGNCIRRWLKVGGQGTCPVCRFPILSPEAVDACFGAF